MMGSNRQIRGLLRISFNNIFQIYFSIYTKLINFSCTIIQMFESYKHKKSVPCAQFFFLFQIQSSFSF